MQTLEQQLNKEREKSTEFKLKNDELGKQIETIADNLSQECQKFTDLEEKLAE